MSITEIRHTLLDRGYVPLPVNGKEVHMPEWTTKLIDLAEIETWPRRWAKYSNTGLLTERTPALDADILDPVAIGKIYDMVIDRYQDRGELIFREGRPPKFAALFQTDKPFKKYKVVLIPRYGGSDGQEEGIEFLCDGQQVVVHGIHPGTGKPYKWLEQVGPLQVPRSKLPYIEEEEARQLVDAIVDMLVVEHGYKKKTEDNYQEQEPTPLALASEERKQQTNYEEVRNRNYARAALESEIAELARLTDGRNTELNNAALKLGRFVGARLLSESEVVERLYAVSVDNGEVAKKGEKQTRATIRSGLSSGVKLPRDIPDLRQRRQGNGHGSRRNNVANATAASNDAGIDGGAAIDTADDQGPGSKSKDNAKTQSAAKGKARTKTATARTALTENQVAREFVNRNRDKIRFNCTTGKWLIWTGFYWRQDDTCIAAEWARTLIEAKNKDSSAKIQAITGKRSFLSGVEGLARIDQRVTVVHDQLDRDPMLLGTPSGTVDLVTGILRPSDQTDLITKITAVTPNADMKTPLWSKFLKESTNNDDRFVDFLRKFFGYCLTGETRDHALLFIYGPGGNGKTVFLNTVAHILGEYWRAAAMETFTASKTDRHPTELAMLRGARLVTASETEEGRAWAESRIKQLTGGDPISGRFMRQDFFTFTPQFKLVIIGNHKPVLKNVDAAAIRRINMAPFVHTPETPDRELEQKLKAEWPGILAWMINGCVTWKKDGLTRPEVVNAATKKYFADQNTVQQWIDECCEVGNGLRDTSAALFASWSKWSIKNGEKPGTSNGLSTTLERLGFELKRTNRARGLTGIRVIPEESELI